MSAQTILFYLNGKRCEVHLESALSPLLTYLRNTQRLTGAKLGCGVGGCGACTVLFSSYDITTRKIIHRAVNACLLPVAACDGAAITTVEAVSDPSSLAPFQKALVDHHGTQCGFCTPGFVMSMFAILREHAARNLPFLWSEVIHAFDGNLCRCTGYRPIMDAFRSSLSEQSAETCAMGTQCCKVKDRPIEDVPSETQQFPSHNATGLDREYVFPPQLIRFQPSDLELADGRWIRPVSLEKFILARQKFPKSEIVLLSISPDLLKQNETQSSYLCATHVPELSTMHQADNGIHIGACATWKHLQDFLKSIISKDEHKDDDSKSVKSYHITSMKALNAQLKRFRNTQYRNAAPISSIISHSSAVSDINPIWMAVGATFTLLDCSTRKERTIAASNFFTSYRKVNMTDSEILLNIFIPWNQSPFDITHAFKVSRRREDDIAIVSSGIRLHLELRSGSEGGSASEREGGHWVIRDVAIAFGGLGPTSVRAMDVEEEVRGKRFSGETLDCGIDVISKSLKLAADVPGGMAEFRVSVAAGFLFKAFVQSAMKVDEEWSGVPSAFGQLGLEGGVEGMSEGNVEETYKGVQIWPDVKGEKAMDVTGEPIKHAAADIQVCGEAKYLDDIGKVEGELQGVFVLSSEAHAEIISVDDSEARKMPGVHSIVKIGDVRGSNAIGPVFLDEECFAKDKVSTVGQVIALVTAETLEEARRAADAVRIEYKVLPAIVTIEEAIEGESYMVNEPSHCVEKGDVDEALGRVGGEGRIVEGEVRIGAQEHWYLEPQGTIAIPEENGEMTILSSTQAPGKTQITVASVLGEPMHKVVCKVKRLGGGFGGKETRNIFISAATAVAAQKTRRPIRVILDRDTDMLTTGTRHAFLAKYKAAFEPDGRITALDLRIFLNMGNTADLSTPVLDRSLHHGMNCYDIPNIRFVGRACLTNSASATAFRGFGAPQGMMIAETVIERVAWATKQSPLRVRDLNMYGKNGNGCETPVGMKFNPTPLVDCWDGVLADAKFTERKSSVEEFNRKHSLRKRGIAAIPTMFGISFTFKTYNQAGALVNIYQGDGSVLISHGGVEMGQGLHTKLCQVAATQLSIPMEKIHISETATDKVPNASPTAASSSSDLYGMAVKKACETLNKNLQVVKDELGPEATWERVVQKAWFDRIALSATGFYKTPHLDGIDLSKPGARGRPFFYYTNGAAVSEVEIDVLTGESSVIRTDIVMDVGRALNPAIDVGQIEGGFIQGLGWCTMEEVVRGSSNSHVWVKAGQTVTLGPSTYKIPGFLDIPKDFRVRILNSRNEQDSIHSSKAIGEPPLFLAASVFFGIRDAIGACRREHGLEEWFELDSPASVERIRMACGDNVLRKVIGEDGMNTRPSLSL